MPPMASNTLQVPRKFLKMQNLLIKRGWESVQQISRLFFPPGSDLVPVPCLYPSGSPTIPLFLRFPRSPSRGKNRLPCPAYPPPVTMAFPFQFPCGKLSPPPPSSPCKNKIPNQVITKTTNCSLVFNGDEDQKGIENEPERWDDQVYGTINDKRWREVARTKLFIGLKANL